MDWYLISVLIFVVILAVIVFRDRRKFTRDSVLLLRKTKKGRGLIIKLGTRFPRGLKLLGFVSVGTGFIGSVIGMYMFLGMLLQAFTTKEVVEGIAVVGASPTAQPVILPGVILIPFWYWIISITLLVVVHEGFHGIFTARENVRIKSLGVGILAIIPLAFMEPDERQLEKKGTWPQLRVFSAGSFANFLLAGLVLLIISSPLLDVFSANTVALKGYLARDVMISDIEQIDNITIHDVNDLKNLNLSSDGSDRIITIKTLDETYISRPSILREELDESNKSVILMLDYPAFRSNLTGLIIKIDDYDLGNIDDSGKIKNVNLYQKNLSLALEKIGAGKKITIITGNRTKNQTYTLITAARPYPEPYKPDLNVKIDLAIESVIPGYWHFSAKIDETGEYIAMSLAEFIGQPERINWDYAQGKINFWRFVRDNAPNEELESHAEAKIGHWEHESSKYQRLGYLGISAIPGVGGVAANAVIKPELASFEESIFFVSGLLFFIFLINLGVGIVNLLPAKPLDGGRMWDVVLHRYVPKHADKIMKLLGRFVLVMIVLLFIAAFFPIGALL